jgi:hypothetical protein
MWPRVVVILQMTAGAYVLSSACSTEGHPSSYDAEHSASDADTVVAGDLGTNAESCYSPCEQIAATGPQVEASAEGDAIVAIRTFTKSTSSIGNNNGCTVSWSGWTLSSSGKPTTACIAPNIDASTGADGCAQRYECEVPYGRATDGGLGCGSVWVNLSVPKCEVTVYSISGKQQTFEVEQTGFVMGYDCRTGAGQCVHTGSVEVSPNHVTLSFGGVDGGSG